jgi:hypothetical protein
MAELPKEGAFGMFGFVFLEWMLPVHRTGYIQNDPS